MSDVIMSFDFITTVLHTICYDDKDLSSLSSHI